MCSYNITCLYIISNAWGERYFSFTGIHSSPFGYLPVLAIICKKMKKKENIYIRNILCRIGNIYRTFGDFSATLFVSSFQHFSKLNNWKWPGKTYNRVSNRPNCYQAHRQYHVISISDSIYGTFNIKMASLIIQKVQLSHINDHEKMDHMQLKQELKHATISMWNSQYPVLHFLIWHKLASYVSPFCSVQFYCAVDIHVK